MGDPAASTGGQALRNITQRGAPYTSTSDPVWDDIESTFQDVLGEYANLDLDMPIQPPDMSDSQDQMRYLKDLEALGMSSAPSAALMGRNISAAMDLITAQSKAQKEQFDQVFKLLPMLEGNKDLQANMAAGLMNTLMPGQFDVQDQSLLGGFGPFDEEPGVTRLTPENVLDGQLYQGISATAVPRASEFAKADDKTGLKHYLDVLLEQLLAGKIDEAVAITIVNQIHADAIGARMAEEPVY